MTDSPDAPRLRDRQPKELRREQLIQATIEVIGRKGYSGTTIADVASAAKLSRGIVNFHFDSKDKLFHATLQSMTEEYNALWRRALAKAGRSPAARLRALVDADFDPALCTPRKISAWFAFMAEARPSAIYRKISGTRDDQLLDAIRDQCTALMAGSPHGYDPDPTARAIYALLEGLWLRMMLEAPRFKRDHAHLVALTTLGLMFPNHFTPEGRIRS
ncbi:TetR family transcriptional regulator C-terminal domain-containing protein [Seohaeicola nanhaiensis]|uniref:TetR family transcriptional regulator C-terminal domain-containing protein n=1 Tax=Seohaeicola nanhaiensis TaxID=1387282 RepID=A0ABV9KDL8_9RHOB